jgi:hypothetical protein
LVTIKSEIIFLAYMQEKISIRNMMTVSLYKSIAC